MALLLDEEGKTVVAAALAGRSAISVVNWAEVLSKAAERGGDPVAVEAEYREKGFIGKALTIEPLSEADCIEVGKLRPLTERQGLSLADRVCLANTNAAPLARCAKESDFDACSLGLAAARLGVPALTSDGAFADADVEAEVVLIR